MSLAKAKYDRIFVLIAYKTEQTEKASQPIPVVGILGAGSPCEQDYGEECEGNIGGGGSFVQAEMREKQCCIVLLAINT